VTQLNFEHGARTRRSVRRTMSARRLTGLVICGVLVVIAVALGLLRLTSSGSNSNGAAPAAPSLPYLGVYEPGSPQSYANVDAFARAVGRSPNLVTYYSFWYEPFQTTFAETAAAHGATTIVQMMPNVSLAKIASGGYDSYLKFYASQVADFKKKVVISFGHEMNGYWYSWGYHNTPAPTFVAAWKRVVDVFRQQGANNVIWLWQVNSLNAQTGPPQDWWPGANYVTWVGVSGYYYLPGDNFDNVFNPVVFAIRQFTQDPLLIAETAVGPQAGQQRGIADLFAGIRIDHFLGLVWFDQHSTGGLYKGEDWRIEGDQTAIKAFRAGLNG
jgi:mannan endo-1,4-beta-mannosidase